MRSFASAPANEDQTLTKLLAVNFVDTSPLHSGGPVDDHMQYVFGFMFWASVAVGGLVSVALVYAFFRFRRRDEDDPSQFHGNTKLEIAWTLVPFLILVTLFGITAANMGFIYDPPGKAMNVKVTGQRFSWTFDYLGKKKKSGTDVTSTTTLHVPADTPIALDLVSTDVIHSFYVPSLAGQLNNVPGQVNHMWFQAREGHYYGQCTELCGAGHSAMLLEVDAVPKDKFQDWLYQQEAT